VTDRLACSGVTVRFGGVVAVSDVDLGVPPGATVGLVGPNGAGKSTLFDVLSGLVRPSSGRVLVDGEDVTDFRPQVRADRGLARTFQHPELFPDLNVREHLVVGYRAKHARRRAWSDLVTVGSLRRADAGETSCVEELLALLGLESVADRPALALPLGLARLVELGRALASSPTVLLLDEPSSGLDSSETCTLEDTLRRVGADRDLSILLVEHDVDLVMRMCDSVYVLDSGVLIANGPPHEVQANPRVRAAYLGEEVQSGGATARAPEPVASLGSHPATVEPAEPAEPASDDHCRSSERPGPAPLLEVDDLWVRYGSATALSGVSFGVGAGETVAVLGANGAGKSSLARAVTGLVDPTQGRVVFDGVDITRWPAHRIRLAGMVHLPEVRGVFPALTVTENLRMAAGAVEGRSARRDAIEKAYEIFPALAARRRQPARLLSGGEQQMLSLARALIVSPRLLIADELSLGLAPKLVDQVFEGLQRAKSAGVAIVVIEQYVHRALALADRCVVLQHGVQAWSGSAEATESQILRRYLGEAMTVPT
jgi:branched-chain amino acid transport system ATP-binding protein